MLPPSILVQILDWLQLSEAIRFRRLDRAVNAACLQTWRPSEITVDRQNHSFLQHTLLADRQLPQALGHVKHLTLQIATPFTAQVLKATQSTLKTLNYSMDKETHSNRTAINKSVIKTKSNSLSKSHSAQSSLSTSRSFSQAPDSSPRHFLNLTDLSLTGFRSWEVFFALCQSSEGQIILPALTDLTLIGCDLVQWHTIHQDVHFYFPSLKRLSIRWPLGRTVDRVRDALHGLLKGCSSSLEVLKLGGTIGEGVSEEDALDLLTESPDKSFILGRTAFLHFPKLKYLWLDRIREPLTLLKRYPAIAPMLQNISARTWEVTYVVPSVDSHHECWPLSSRCDWLKEANLKAKKSGYPPVSVLRCAFDRFIGRLWSEPAVLNCGGLERIEIVSGNFSFETTARGSSFGDDDSWEETFARTNVLLPCLTFEKEETSTVIEVRVSHPGLFLTRRIFREMTPQFLVQCS